MEQTKNKGRGIYPRGGWIPKAPEERKVQIFGSVKKKHFKEAEQAVKELLKQWK